MSAAKTPTRCLSCEGMLNGSLEHVFPQALGGTKTSRNLYCSVCNLRLGTDVDAPFAKDFEFATTVLNVKRDRGQPPTLKVTTADGQKIYLGPGGVPSPQGPSPPVIEEHDGKKHITIIVPADRPELHGHMLAKVAKELGVDVAALGEGTMSLRSTSVGTVNATVSIGGPSQDRAVAKIALGFLALEIGDDVFSEPFAALRLAAVVGREVRAWRQPLFRAFAATMLPETDDVQHRVLIYATGSETWAHVEVYGAVGYAVLLAEISDARFASPYVWGQNPTTGASGEGREPGIPVPTPVRAHVELDKNDFAGLIRTWRRVGSDVAYQRTIDEEVAIAFAGLAEGEEINEAFIDGLSRRIAERLVAFQDSNGPLNLSRPIVSRDELEKIRRALRAVPGSRSK